MLGLIFSLSNLILLTINISDFIKFSDYMNNEEVYTGSFFDQVKVIIRRKPLYKEISSGSLNSHYKVSSKRDQK